MPPTTAVKANILKDNNAGHQVDACLHSQTALTLSAPFQFFFSHNSTVYTKIQERYRGKTPVGSRRFGSVAEMTRGLPRCVTHPNLPRQATLQPAVLFWVMSVIAYHYLFFTGCIGCEI